MLQHLTRPYQYEQLNKRSEQMYKLIAICIRYAALLLLYYCFTTALLLLNKRSEQRYKLIAICLRYSW